MTLLGRWRLEVTLSLLRAGAVPPRFDSAPCADEEPCIRCAREYRDLVLARSIRKAVWTSQLGADWLCIAEYLCTLPGNSERKSLRGINIQWPYSQFILHGRKTVECRRYPLASRGFALPDEELWLIETPGRPSSNRTRTCYLHSWIRSPRPTRARVVGIVNFSHGFQYDGVPQFDADCHRHLIPSDSRFHWSGAGEMHGWHVQAVRLLKYPIEAGKKEMKGWSRPRTLSLN